MSDVFELAHLRVFQSYCFVFLQLEDKKEEMKVELKKKLQGLNSDGEEKQLS